MSSIFNIKDYGAESGKSTIQTDKIQAVLDLAGKAGGTVIIPKGTYVTGGLLMHGNTELHLESGAVLIGSANPDDYRIFPVPTMFQSIPMRKCSSDISVKERTNPGRNTDAQSFLPTEQKI